jgi:hypothetical protein
MWLPVLEIQPLPQVPTKADEHTKQEIMALYRELAKLVLDKAYRECSRALHPIIVSKSVFLETLIEQGLAHLDELKPLLKEAAEGDIAT